VTNTGVPVETKKLGRGPCTGEKKKKKTKKKFEKKEKSRRTKKRSGAPVTNWAQRDKIIFVGCKRLEPRGGREERQTIYSKQKKKKIRER